MNINVRFNNNTYIIKTKIYQSIHSIINQFIDEQKIEYNIDDLFLDYNGTYLDNNFSLEKYNINDNNTLNLNIKIKGGNSFISFLTNHPFICIFSLLISLLPLIILPSGYIPSLSSLIESILNKSFSSIGRYLVCVLGKHTLFNRVQWIITLIKYSVFFLMVYVTITLPLTLLCITLKGHAIADSPSSMCSPLSYSSYTGMLLTMAYIFVYGFYRIGNIILSGIMNIFKKTYITDTLFNPILSSLLNLYNTSKYVPIYFTPFIGQGLMTYFSVIDTGLVGFQSVLNTVMQLGCKTQFNKRQFTDILGKSLNKSVNDMKNKDNKNDTKSYSKSSIEVICISDAIQCCNSNNFFNIADTIKTFVENPVSEATLKSFNVYSIFILMIEALYEYGLSNLGIQGKIPNNANERVEYLKEILNDKSNKLSNDTISVIKGYLSTFNTDLLSEIETKVDMDIKNNIDKIESIKDNLLEVESLMIKYAHESGSTYVPGNSLFKIVLKYLFLNSMCNVFQTSKTSLDVMNSMKGVTNIADMVKAGTSTGVVVGFFYFIALIVLIIMGVFNKY